MLKSFHNFSMFSSELVFLKWCRSFMKYIVTFYKSSSNPFPNKDLFLIECFHILLFARQLGKCTFFVLLLLPKLFIHQQYQINIHNFSDFYVTMFLRTKGARPFTFINYFAFLNKCITIIWAFILIYLNSRNIHPCYIVRYCNNKFSQLMFRLLILSNVIEHVRFNLNKRKRRDPLLRQTVNTSWCYYMYRVVWMKHGLMSY